jgi:hypothetical protein
MLANVAQALKVLSREFEESDDIVDDHKRAIGASDLTDALDEFANNWKLHRKGLLGSMESLQEMAETSHETYVEADAELARAARQHGDRPEEATS